MKKHYLFGFGVIIHVIFLLSIFDIYFKSPILSSVPSESNHITPPGKRVVLFSVDGLRVDSLFDVDPFNKQYVAKYMLDIIKYRGRWGISHTRVPTESRPGHVAMLAGFYEDPSAITKGDTKEYDNWVYEKFQKFIKTTSHREHLEKKGIFFFLHFLGQDTSGHTDKPHSVKYRENLKNVDELVMKIETLFENFYHDNDTTFIFTSDHGMTDWGSHGAGTVEEVNTPFIAWGSGIKKPFDSSEQTDINQADITPLVSILLGSSIPVNSIGVLPTEYLDMPYKHIAEAIKLNAKQIVAQYIKAMQNLKEQTLSWLHFPFKDLKLPVLSSKLQSINNLINLKKYSEANLESKILIENSLRGLDYYQNYYQIPLLMCISLSYLGWIAYLLLVLFDTVNEVSFYRTFKKYDNKFLFVVRLLGILISTWNNYTIHNHFNKYQSLIKFNQCISWILLVASFFLLFWGDKMIMKKLVEVFMTLSIPFILLSITHEGFFLMFLFIHLYCWILIEKSLNNQHSYYSDFRIAYFFLTYIFLSFFGLGNISSLNSFDTAWVRCFLTVFMPFIMSALIILKTVIPFLVVCCTMRTITSILKIQSERLFVIVLLFCNVMALNFLFLIKNKGSWLDIGMSISHYVLQQVTIVFLLILFYIAKFLLQFTYNTSNSLENIVKHTKPSKSLPIFYDPTKIHKFQ
ncbi:conserved hypothetical protein [Pediculus humanus corporis]|uniref:GPI ethanolamine phosphate transferase 1 n=1 Tax=Pediculus humanus subsp. corporis TaxID=121224 RepID=E0VCU4_PEDHC|nr:uncharacterized protein Phum_PHUM097470 [Pediculus humanus corporis]EEB11200.1 conserved hypothetical protein [Pediculus humanus corporis]